MIFYDSLMNSRSMIAQFLNFIVRHYHLVIMRVFDRTRIKIFAFNAHKKTKQHNN
jgi:hypothetical protein